LGRLKLAEKKLYGARQVEYKEGCDLDEMQAHVFLEKMGETLTVRALRQRLKELDLDNNKKMCVSEYLLARYKKTPKELADAPQGIADPAALNAAKARLEAVSQALAECQASYETATTAEAKAKKALSEAKVAEDALVAAEAELKTSVDELHKVEKEYQDKLASLKKIADDESAGAVKRNKAKNELAQLQAEDPLPLRKAKITQGAALKRAETARATGEKARAQAEGDKEAAERARAAASAQLKATERAMDEAAEELEKVKRKGDGVPQGQIWWMEREMSEKRKFLPK